MNIADKLMIAGILIGLSISLLGCYMAYRYENACSNINDKVIKYEQMNKIHLL
jgi:hypothetical protein